MERTLYSKSEELGFSLSYTIFYPSQPCKTQMFLKTSLFLDINYCMYIKTF
jgi:hypothetical protein